MVTPAHWSPTWNSGTDKGFQQNWQLPFSTPNRVPTMDINGNLLPNFKLDVTQKRPDSPWLKLQTQLEGNRYAAARGDALGENRSMVAGGLNNLASTGGLSSGARERLQQSGVRDFSNTLTGLSNQHSQNILGLRTQDFTNQVNADKWNLTNNFNEINNQAAHDWSVFDTQAKAYGADQLAKAYGGGFGGGGGPFGPGGPLGPPGFDSGEQKDPQGRGGIYGMGRWRGDGWNDRDGGILGKDTWNPQNWHNRSGGGGGGKKWYQI